MGTKLTEWYNLVADVSHIILQRGKEMFLWALHKNNIFSVRSMYKYLINTGVKISQEIWHMKAQLKLKCLYGKEKG